MFTKVFITWAADAFAADIQRCIQGDHADDLRRLQQKSDGADMIWKSWAMTNDGSVLSTVGGQGSMEMPPEKLVDLPRLMKQYAGAIGAQVAMGVGAKLSEAQRALVVSKLRGGNQIVLYSTEIEDEIEESKKKPDPMADILDEEHHDESAVQKALRKSAVTDDPTLEHIQVGRPVTVQMHTISQYNDENRYVSGGHRKVIPGPGVIEAVHTHESVPGKIYAVTVRDESNTTHPNDVRKLFVREKSANAGGGTQWTHALPMKRAGGGFTPIEHEKLAAYVRGREAWDGVIGSPTSKNIVRPFSPGAHTLLHQQHVPTDDEGVFNKAIPGQNAGPGAGFGGFSTGGGAAAPTSPTQEASEHSDAEALQAQINDPERPPPPEQTHAAQALEDTFHNLASQQDVKDAQQSQEQQTDITAVKGAVATMLQQVRAQSAQIGALKQQAPDIYNVVTGLVQSVISMARTLSGPGQPLTKAEAERIKSPEELEREEGREGSIQPRDPVTIAENEKRPGEVSHVYYDEKHEERRAHAMHVIDQVTGKERFFVRTPRGPLNGGNVWLEAYPAPRLFKAIANLGQPNEPHLIPPGQETPSGFDAPDEKNVYDYTHMLSEAERARGDKLELRHAPGKFDDFMVVQHFLHGQERSKAWAYSHEADNAVARGAWSQDPLHRALEQHGHWNEVQKARRLLIEHSAIQARRLDEYWKKNPKHSNAPGGFLASYPPMFEFGAASIEHHQHIPDDNEQGDSFLNRKSELKKAGYAPYRTEEGWRDGDLHQRRRDGQQDAIKVGMPVTLTHYHRPAGTLETPGTIETPGTVTQVHVDDRPLEEGESAEAHRVHAVHVRDEQTGIEHLIARLPESAIKIGTQWKDVTRWRSVNPSTDLTKLADVTRFLDGRLQEAKVEAQTGPMGKHNWNASVGSSSGHLTRMAPEAMRKPYEHADVGAHMAWWDHSPEDTDNMQKSGIKLPMPKAPTHKDLELPVGSVKEGGPTGNAQGDVGKRKVQHGDGSTTWVQARAGQVTAVADRHAQPVIGQASHPISSRNPTGH